MRRGVALVLTTVLLGLGSLAHALGGGWTSDEFDGALAATWTVLGESPEDWSLATLPGTLTITTRAGDLAGGGNDARNVFVQDAPNGDFRVTTRVRFAADASGEQAGLLLRATDDEYVLLAVANRDGARVVELSRESGGAPARQTSPADERELWLRLERAGGQVAAYASHDGVLWRAVGTVAPPSGDAVGMGLLATAGPGGAGGAAASFDFFRAEAPPGATTRTTPPDVTLSAAPTAGETPLEVTFTVDLSYDYPGARWSFTPGDGADGQSGVGLPVTFRHSYGVAGEHDATVVVTNGRDTLGSRTLTVAAASPPPPPEPTPPTSGGGAPTPPTSGGPVATPTPEPTPPAAVQRAAGVFVASADEDLPTSVARGDARVVAVDVRDASRAVLVVVAPDGTETTLAEGAGSARWNTSAFDNGYYRVEVRETREDGSTVTLASTLVRVENPRATLLATAAAVAVGVAVAGGASAAASGLLGQRGLDFMTLFEETGIDVYQDRLRDRTRDVLARRLRMRQLATAGLTVLLLGLFFAVAEIEAWDLRSAGYTLLVVGTAALLFSVAKYAAEYALAVASGAAARFRLWVPGVFALALSSVVFRNPFGYPGYVDENEPGDDTAPAQRRIAGLRALAFLGLSVAFALPFMLASRLGLADFGEAGLLIALTALATSAMPFRPVPGSDVWAWSRAIWAGAAAVAVALYFGFQLALVPWSALVAVGLVGLAGFVWAMLALRHAPHA